MATTHRASPHSRERGLLERPGRIRLTVVLAVLGGLTVLSWSVWRAGGLGGVSAGTIPGDHEPTFLVEVLNGTEADGLAREVTRRLRRAGIDVVSYASSRDSTLDSTIIFVRRGDSTGALKVRDVLGAGRIVMAPNPALLLDASVLVGPDLARALGFRP